MKEKLEQIKNQAVEALRSAKDLKEIDDVRVRFLGKKGELTAILKQMGGLSAEERPVIGQLANKIRAEIEETLNLTLAGLKDKATEMKLAAETVDITMPGKKTAVGGLHPLSIVIDDR